MSSAMRVGREVRSFAIHLKSSRAWWTPLLRSTRVLLLGEIAFWRRPNILRAPGRAIAMDRSSPRTVCHFFMLVRRCDLGMLSRISQRRSMRWGGKWIVMLIVSTIHPSTSLMVSQLQSPLRSFLRETGSRRNGESPSVTGRKTWSIEWSKVLRMRRVLGACPSDIKSSTKMSTYSRGFPVVGRDGSRVLGTSTAMPGVGARDWLGRSGNGTSAAIWSRRWLGGW